jgi:hypothetical protein
VWLVAGGEGLARACEQQTGIQLSIYYFVGLIAQYIDPLSEIHYVIISFDYLSIIWYLKCILCWQKFILY